MGFLRNNLVSLLDSTFSRTSSLLDSMSRTLDDWDAETQLSLLEEKGSNLMKTGNQMLSGWGGFLRQIRENSNLFVVRVPYDEEKEAINYEINDNVLTVTKESSTKNSQSQSVTTATIPEECDISQLKISYNKKKQLMAYVFPKKTEE